MAVNYSSWTRTCHIICLGEANKLVGVGVCGPGRGRRGGAPSSVTVPRASVDRCAFSCNEYVYKLLLTISELGEAYSYFNPGEAYGVVVRDIKLL